MHYCFPRRNKNFSKLFTKFKVDFFQTTSTQIFLILSNNLFFNCVFKSFMIKIIIDVVGLISVLLLLFSICCSDFLLLYWPFMLFLLFIVLIEHFIKFRFLFLAYELYYFLKCFFFSCFSGVYTISNITNANPLSNNNVLLHGQCKYLIIAIPNCSLLSRASLLPFISLARTHPYIYT